MSGGTVEGILKNVEEPRQVSESFTVRGFIIEEQGQYPQLLNFQVSGDKINIVNPSMVGSMINVHYNLRGMKKPTADGRVFNNLSAWKIEGGTQQAPQQVPQQVPQNYQQQAPQQGNYQQPPQGQPPQGQPAFSNGFQNQQPLEDNLPF